MNTQCADFLLTVSGREFHYTDPKPEQIDIFDIAHALSMNCRYNGHVRHFYSVAQHCIALCHHYWQVDEDLAKVALMHDAAEAYTSDIPSPLKKALPDFLDIEKNIEAVVLNTFSIPLSDMEKIKDGDTRICVDEMLVLMPAVDPTLLNREPLGLDRTFFEPMVPELARAKFLELAYIFVPEAFPV